MKLNFTTRNLFLICVLPAVSGVAQNRSTRANIGAESPLTVGVLARVRTNAVQWFDAPPYSTTYPYVEQLLRYSVAQRIRRFDWLLEGSENAVFDVPNTSISPVTAQGQLGQGGTYYAANANTLPVAASFRQGYVRYHGNGPNRTFRIGRFEYLDGQEMQPGNAAIAWLQSNRISQRLIGNFGFSNGQRSFDGFDAHYGDKRWDVTALAGRPTQGVYNMNANPELNVDIQYLTLTRSEMRDHVMWRVFALGYHDGRTGVVKTDNRPVAVRQGDHKNIRLGTYGGNFLANVPAGSASVDVLFWAALQNGRWGLLDHRAGAVATEAGLRFDHALTTPWVRAGWLRSTGDNTPGDNRHNTFFDNLPTPRGYARFPFYNDMNRTEEFIQVMDKPSKKVDVRSDLHFLQLTAANDLWYQGGGAFDSKVFGFVGRSSGGHTSFATLADASVDAQLTASLTLSLYYAHAFGRSVVRTDYPAGSQANFGYLELLYKFSHRQKTATPAKP